MEEPHNKIIESMKKDHESITKIQKSRVTFEALPSCSGTKKSRQLRRNAGVHAGLGPREDERTNGKHMDYIIWKKNYFITNKQ